MLNDKSPMRIEIKDLKKGDRFYERDGVFSAYCEALEDGHEVNDEKAKMFGHKCSVKMLICCGHDVAEEDQKPYTIFAAHDAGAYGPKLYNA